MSKSREFYANKIHGKYYDPSSRTVVPNRYRAIVAAVKKWAGTSPGKVLEVGSESPLIPRYWGRQLGVALEDIHLLEISSVSAQLLRRSGFQVDVVDISAERLPFVDGSISVALLSEVIEHLIDPDFALEELRRVLRPRGLLVVTTPNIACWENRIGVPLGWQPLFTETGTEWVFNRGRIAPKSRPVGHLHVFTLGAIRSLLEFHGYTVQMWGGLPLEPENVSSRIGRFIDHVGSRFPSLASGLLLVASSLSGI